jgi:hypothetical protein
MEDTLEAYLMFLGRPWLKQAKFIKIGVIKL